MHKVKDIYRSSPAVFMLTLGLAILIQIQASLFTTEDYLGLRLNLADLLLPVSGIIILSSLLLKKSKWPAFSVPWLPPALCALSLWFFFSLYRGLSIDPGMWSLVNKGAGWFVLLAYFALGAWIRQNGPANILQLFVEIFVLVFFGILLAFTALYAFEDLGVKEVMTWPNSYLSLLLDNRNIAGFFSISTLLLLHALPDKTLLLPRHVFRYVFCIFLFILPYTIFLNGSRVYLAYGIFSALYIGFQIFKNKDTHYKKYMGALILGLCMLPLFLQAQNVKSSIAFYKYMGDPSTLEDLQKLPEDKFQKNLKTSSNPMREYILRTSLKQWKEQPLLGTGIGVYVKRQAEMDGFFLNIIDSTPLWFLVETGLIGLSLLLLFFGGVVWAIIKNMNGIRSEQKLLYQSVITIFLLFAAMSFVHELTYTRFIWLLAGMFTAIPSKSAE